MYVGGACGMLARHGGSVAGVVCCTAPVLASHLTWMYRELVSGREGDGSEGEGESWHGAGRRARHIAKYGSSRGHTACAANRKLATRDVPPPPKKKKRNKTPNIKFEEAGSSV